MLTIKAFIITVLAGIGSIPGVLLGAILLALPRPCTCGVPVLIAIPFAAIIAALSAVLMLPIIRLSGSYFALAILGYAQIFYGLAVKCRSGRMVLQA